LGFRNRNAVFVIRVWGDKVGHVKIAAGRLIWYAFFKIEYKMKYRTFTIIVGILCSQLK